jgi:hypothetical protein
MGKKSGYQASDVRRYNVINYSSRPRLLYLFYNHLLLLAFFIVSSRLDIESAKVSL